MVVGMKVMFCHYFVAVVVFVVAVVAVAVGADVQLKTS